MLQRAAAALALRRGSGHLSIWRMIYTLSGNRNWPGSNACNNESLRPLPKSSSAISMQPYTGFLVNSVKTARRLALQVMQRVPIRSTPHETKTRLASKGRLKQKTAPSSTWSSCCCTSVGHRGHINIIMGWTCNRPSTISWPYSSSSSACPRKNSEKRTKTHAYTTKTKT